MSGNFGKQGEPNTPQEWKQLCDRHLDDAKGNRTQGRFHLSYDAYGFATEATAKAMIMRQKGWTQWPRRPHADAEHVHTHSIQKLIKFAGVFQDLCQERRTNEKLQRNWYLVKEWIPARYQLEAPSSHFIAQFALAVTHEQNGLIAWMDRQ